MIRPSQEIVRKHRPLIGYDMKKVLSVLNVGNTLLIPEESDEVVSTEVKEIANKLIRDAISEIASRN